MFNTSISKVIETPIVQIMQDIAPYNFCNPQNSALKIRFNHKLLEKEIYYYWSINAIKGKLGRFGGEEFLITYLIVFW